MSEKVVARMPAWLITATRLLESMPPERNTPTGTSLTRCESTACEEDRGGLARRFRSLASGIVPGGVRDRGCERRRESARFEVSAVRRNGGTTETMWPGGTAEIPSMMVRGFVDGAEGQKAEEAVRIELARDEAGAQERANFGCEKKLVAGMKVVKRLDAQGITREQQELALFHPRARGQICRAGAGMNLLPNAVGSEDHLGIGVAIEASARGFQLRTKFAKVCRSRR